MGILAELEDVDSQINTLNETTHLEGDLDEELTYGCSPDQIGRRRGNEWADGGRCSCRRRNGMSSTGMYACKGNRMEYYGGADADDRRRRTWQKCSNGAYGSSCKYDPHGPCEGGCYKWHCECCGNGCDWICRNQFSEGESWHPCNNNPW